MEQDAAVDRRPDRVQLELELGDDAEVAAAATQIVDDVKQCRQVLGLVLTIAEQELHDLGGRCTSAEAAARELAQRLEANPNDLPGWLRLIRAYAVLGDKEKAAAALAKARSVFANEAQAQAQLGQAAQENALN